METETITQEWHRELVNEAILGAVVRLTPDAELGNSSNHVRWLLTPTPPATALALVAELIGCRVPDVLQIAMQALALDEDVNK